MNVGSKKKVFYLSKSGQVAQGALNALIPVVGFFRVDTCESHSSCVCVRVCERDTQVKGNASLN